MDTEPTPETGPKHRLDDTEPVPVPEDETAPEPEDGHELDEAGEPIHVDVDPVIPTGICRHCPRG